MQKILIYKGFERFWHWMQALLILFLGFTGFEIHGSLSFFGFQNAVRYHRIAAWSFLVLIAFAIFWHFTTGEWRQYLPTRKHLRAYIDYYVAGIFRGAPHPTRKTLLSKLNPLQRLTYLSLKLIVFPVMVTSGLLYTFYRYPDRYGIETFSLFDLRTIAFWHTAGAFCLVAFVIAHLYLITTGRTVTSNLKAMLTGFEDIGEPSGSAAPDESTAAANS